MKASAILVSRGTENEPPVADDKISAVIMIGSIFRVRDKARLSTKTTAYGIKGKKQLMWGSLFTSLPNSEIREQATNFVFLA